MNRASTGLDRDPVRADLLPGGELGNHGIDAEFEGVRPTVARLDGLMVTLRCAGGSGWHLDDLGRHALYPAVAELALQTPAAELGDDEADALAAWCDEGVPVRLRGLVGDTPTLVLDDGWRVVVLPRPSLSWTLAAG